MLLNLIFILKEKLSAYFIQQKEKANVPYL